jgi:hypothetical protein
MRPRGIYMIPGGAIMRNSTENKLRWNFMWDSKSIRRIPIKDA